MKKILTLLLVMIMLGVGAFYFLGNRASNESSKKYSGFNFISESNVIDSEDFDRVDGQYFLSLDYIKDHIDENVKYDENTKTLTFNNEYGEKIYKVGEYEGTINGQRILLRDTVKEEDGKILVPIEAFIYDYHLDLRYIEDKKVLLMDNHNREYAVGTPGGNGVNMREEPSLTSPIVSILQEDDKLFVYGIENDWYKVREVDGYMGYIRSDMLNVELVDGEYVVDRPTDKKIENLINITWDYTYGNQSDESVERISSIKGLDVICPTWFSIADKDGNITDRGRRDYVEKYKALGIDVWGYLDNSFDPEITNATLSDPAKRKKIIDKTLELCKKYGLVGINIDFEHVNLGDRDNITKFMEELYPVFNAEGMPVSIDVTPQISRDVTKELYDRAALSNVSDYVIVMAYDQHWASSEKEGSVAQYKWVEGNINNLFRSIPREKIVLAVPFYGRVWTVENGKVTSSVATMPQMSRIMNFNNPQWDKESGQYYVEYTDGNATKKLWVEDGDSLELKSSLVLKYNLGGIASWRKGFESQDAFSVIDNVLRASKYYGR